MKRRSFTLVELLVVVSIIALLISILLPSLKKARHQSKATVCLSNMRGLEIAHWTYMTEYNGWFVNAGLPHGGFLVTDDRVAWIRTLQKSYGNTLLARSPLDTSPHWGPYPAGQAIPGVAPDKRRQTSYGVNNFLTDVSQNGLNPYGPPPSGISPADWPGGDGSAYARLDQIRRPAAVVHFLIMAYEGTYAGADHPHVELWVEDPNPAKAAAKQIQTNAYGGPKEKPESLGHYGFLDAHAERQAFREVFQSIKLNRFDPKVAR